MKKLIFSLGVMMATSTCVMAQVKVLQQNKVVIGCPSCTSQLEEFAVKGNSYFVESPALSGLSIKNENWNGGFNLMGIIPQWNSSTLLGTANLRFFEVHTTQLFVDGVFITSDAKLKSNIEKIASKSALSMVLKLNAYTYNFSEKHYPNVQKEMMPTLLQTGNNQIGVMAQEVQEVLPQLVKQDKKTQQFSVNYVGLIPVLIESIKELQAQISAQNQQIEALQKQLAESKR